MQLLSILFCGLALTILIGAMIHSLQKKLEEAEGEWINLIRQGLSEEFMFLDPQQIKKKLHWTVILGFLFSLVFFSPFPFFGSLILAWGVPYGYLRHVRQKRRKLFEKQFMSVLPEIISALRAGHTFDRALETMTRTQPAPMSQELGLVLKQIRLGQSLQEALIDLHKRFPGRELEMTIRAVSISRRVGSNLAEALGRVSDMLRTRAGLKNKLLALTAQGRAQANICIAMPILLAIGLYIQAPDYLTPLTSTGTGKLLLIYAAASMCVGGYVVQKISKMELLK